MNSIGEGVGAVIEGGLIARAAEPSRGEVSQHPRAQTECLNCGAIVTGAYCGHCGQKAHVHRSLAAIGHDIMHGVLHLDGKLWNTLPLLALKPGELTRRYIAGERAKFVSPMAMFLFSVFAMFAVFQMVGLTAPSDLPDEIAAEMGDDSFSADLQEQITKLEQERSSLPPTSRRRRGIDAEIKVLEALVARNPEAQSSKALGRSGTVKTERFNITGLERDDI